MTKYKEYFQKMLNENKEVFDAFAKLHFEYSMDEDGLQTKFNEEGEKVLEIIREYEDRLCRNTERGAYNKFSGGLAEKFQELVRAHFPLVDHIGLIVTTPQTINTASEEQLSAIATETIFAEADNEEPFRLKKLMNHNSDTTQSYAALDSFSVKKINL